MGATSLARLCLARSGWCYRTTFHRGVGAQYVCGRDTPSLGNYRHEAERLDPNMIKKEIKKTKNLSLSKKKCKKIWWVEKKVVSLRHEKNYLYLFAPCLHCSWCSVLPCDEDSDYLLGGISKG